jgi:hypothetical protein
LSVPDLSSRTTCSLRMRSSRATSETVKSGDIVIAWHPILRCRNPLARVTIAKGFSSFDQNVGMESPQSVPIRRCGCGSAKESRRQRQLPRTQSFVRGRPCVGPSSSSAPGRKFLFLEPAQQTQKNGIRKIPLISDVGLVLPDRTSKINETQLIPFWLFG